ncbi:AAA family ATPase [Streptacidiphilus sp. EB129]|uniref:AAA family ATPase n=1 Tax=Streptacidiphilus sp. EB129 TaxID=3156262 RepID=UPI0035110012
MRLHSLRITAFGPFAGTETVDFDALSADGLFLLHGATGAGKTSVLDAVCFALYGEVPGSRPRSRLRSDHAAAADRTEVVLELTLGGRRLEITRSPEQERVKKRGSGTTVDRPQTLLREWTAADGWTASSRSHQEIGAELQLLLGMSREQFCQVVLLPQGEFARFLHAGALDRAELLGRLFDTARFGQVEAWLTERRQQAEKACQAVQGQISARLERMREAAGPAARAVASETAGAADEEALTWAALLREQLRARLDVAESGRALAAERRDAAARRARQVEVLAERQQRHRRAERLLAELRANADVQRQASERLDRAQRADAVVPLLRLHAEAADTARRTAHAEQQCRARLPRELGAADADALAEAERRAREELGGLRALLAAEEQYHGNELLLGRLEREREDAEALRADAAAWLGGWPAARQRVASALDAAKTAAARDGQLTARLDEALRRAGAADRRDLLTERLAELEPRGASLRSAANDAHEAWLELRERRLLGMAAELAAELAAGAACPVCGSAEHPAPAAAGPDRVTPEQEQQAERRYREATRTAEQLAEELQELRGQAAGLAVEAGGEPASTLRAAAEKLAVEQAAASREAAAGVRAQEESDRLEREHAARTKAAGAAAQLVSALTARLEALEEQQDELAAGLRRGRAGADSVPARLAQVGPLADRLAEASDAVRAALGAAEALRRAEQQARAAAERERFPDLAAASEAALPPGRLAGLRAQVEQYRAELARAEAELADEAVAAAARLPFADPARDHAVLDRADAALRDAHATAQGVRERCAALDRLSTGLADEVRRLEPLAAEHARVAGLASLATGTSRSNELRMSLETYVLAARLEQVAAAAGARLEVMSQGRYTLAHSDARTRGAGRSGLGLTVLDAWTGRHRDTATLSGGESFFASLALALGLADVVTDEAGGMPLDTLFVDEGFGSLDEDTLEDVMDVLDRLRERDRSVGIVSHVSDLRGRIPSQLQVRKGRNGSTLRRLGGGAGTH